MTYSYFNFPRSPWQAGCPRSFVSDTRRIPVSHKYHHGSLMTGSKRVDHWTSEPVCECVNVVRLQALYRAPRQQPTMLVVKLEEGPAASVKLG